MLITDMEKDKTVARTKRDSLHPHIPTAKAGQDLICFLPILCLVCVGVLVRLCVASFTSLIDNIALCFFRGL